MRGESLSRTGTSSCRNLYPSCRTRWNWAAASKRGAHQRDYRSQIAHHQGRLYPKHTIAGASQRGIAPNVGGTPVGVTFSIDFHDQAHARRTEIDDEAAEQRHFSPKLHPELPSLER